MIYLFKWWFSIAMSVYQKVYAFLGTKRSILFGLFEYYIAKTNFGRFRHDPLNLLQFCWENAWRGTELSHPIDLWKKVPSAVSRYIFSISYPSLFGPQFMNVSNIFKQTFGLGHVISILFNYEYPPISPLLVNSQNVLNWTIHHCKYQHLWKEPKSPIRSRSVKFHHVQNSSAGTLWQTNIAIENGPVEIVDLPIHSMVISSSWCKRWPGRVVYLTIFPVNLSMNIGWTKPHESHPHLPTSLWGTLGRLESGEVSIEASSGDIKINNWLVVRFNHLEKWWSSSNGKDDIPYMKLKKKCLKPPTR